MPTDSKTNHLLSTWHKDPRMIVREAEPFNVETDLSALEGTITPISLFFIRNNNTIPQIAPHAWSLRIDGHVDHPFTIDYDALRRLPSVSYVAVVQCSGNARTRFNALGPAPDGVPWRNGAVSNAEWIGVPVRLLLDRAGVRSGAVQVECVGGDDARTTRGVEVAKLLDDAILAYAMNGEPLPQIHGGPVRLIVPGWGGINSIKWIAGLRVLDRESDSIYNQQKYVLVDHAGQQQGKVREIAVTSVIANIAAGARLAAGPTVVRGFAWAPDGGISGVEISVDRGATWQPARLLADLGPRSWRQWEWIWDAPAGEHVLQSRATDGRGNVQPASVEYNQQGYLMNAIESVPVRVD